MESEVNEEAYAKVYAELAEAYKEYNDALWFKYRRQIATFTAMYMLYAWGLHRIKNGLDERMHGWDLLMICVISHFSEIYYRRSIGVS